jgi:hypothetical protein
MSDLKLTDENIWQYRDRLMAVQPKIEAIKKLLEAISPEDLELEIAFKQAVAEQGIERMEQIAQVLTIDTDIVKALHTARVGIEARRQK